MQADSSAPPIILPRPEHSISRKRIDSDALWVMNRLRREGYQPFLVGGAVRDLLLGREPKDFDVGTDARPSEVRRLFRNCRLIGRRFRLAHVYFRRKGQPEKIVEVSTFRGPEQWDDPDAVADEDLDRTGTVFGTAEQDAWRRDFTVNALFYNLSDFSVVDYVGGLADLEQGLIRVLGDPDPRFEEDPVRMLRAVEFAARLGFRIEAGTAAGIRRQAGRIADASAARVREELRQLQDLGLTAEVLAQAHQLGLFGHLFPQVEEMEGVFPLLEELDTRVRDHGRQPEHSWLVALLLPTIVADLPFAPGVNLEEAHRAVAEPINELTRMYHISGHIRHLAKELLLSCYRIARGKSYRSKGKFVRKPEFQEAWALFQVWAKIAPELGETVAYWERYLQGTGTGAAAQTERPARRRRRRRRSGRSRATAPSD